MRKALAKLMTQNWFLVTEAIATPVLIAVVAAWFSKFVPILPLLVTLTAVGWYANRLSYNTGDMYVILGIFFLLSLMFLTLSPATAAAIVGLHVGFLISSAVGNWMDKPNQDALNEQALLDQERTQLRE